MEQQKYIRKCCILKGESINSVAKRTGHHWSTVNKYVEKDDFNDPEKMRKARSTKLDKVKPIIDKWLVEDKKLKPKQRHTARRIYDRLKNEYGEIFNASDRTVRDYVAKRKKELYKEETGFLPLHHPAGEAQVDFGEAEFIEKGIKISGYYLNISYPYSNAGYMQVFHGQNLECLLTGLKSIFEYAGKVPKTIWFDNLSPVVKGIQKHGKRDLTERFEKFSLHYGFGHNFCNPNSGHEKGSVENKVGYHRRNFLVPVPEFDDIDEFNRKLLQLADKDMERLHYKKDEYISKLFEDDKAAMLSLPTKDYEIYRFEKAKVDLYGKVKLDSAYTYSISPAYAGREVWLKITYDKVHILDEDYKKIISHDRLYGNSYESMNWIPYLDLMSRRPTALKYTSFYDTMPDDIRNYFDKCDYDQKKIGLKVLSKMLLDVDMVKVSEVFKEAVEKGIYDEDNLLTIFRRIVNGIFKMDDIILPANIPDIDSYTADISVYDSFLVGGGVS